MLWIALSLETSCWKWTKSPHDVWVFSLKLTLKYTCPTGPCIFPAWDPWDMAGKQKPIHEWLMWFGKSHGSYPKHSMYTYIYNHIYMVYICIFTYIDHKKPHHSWIFKSYHSHYEWVFSLGIAYHIHLSPHRKTCEASSKLWSLKLAGDSYSQGASIGWEYLLTWDGIYQPPFPFYMWPCFSFCR